MLTLLTVSEHVSTRWTVGSSKVHVKVVTALLLGSAGVGLTAMATLNGSPSTFD